MSDLSRRLLRYHGRDAGMRALRDLVRYGHEMGPDEVAYAERHLSDASRSLAFGRPARATTERRTPNVVKLQPSEYEVIEAGVYDALVDSVTPEDANPRFEDARPQLKFIFEITSGDYQGSKVFAWTGQTFGSKSKLRPWLAVLTPSFNPDRDELETDDLIEKRCRIVVSVKKGDDGKERNRVTEVLPLEQRRRPGQQQAQSREPVAAGRRAEPVNEDDVPF